jgi:VCBS repeat-containing protein/autotransporter passenger strand-loop-strand repeat protein
MPIHSGVIVSSPYTVSSGGTDEYDVVVNGGSMVVASGGMADLTTVSSGGSITFAAGSVDSATTVSNGGSLTISSGVTDVLDTIDSGASVTILSGATAFLPVINSGGFLAVNSRVLVSSASITTSASMVVSSGGTNVRATVSGSGSFLSVTAGGTDSATTVNGFATLIVSSGGVVIGDIIKAGTLHVKSGGTATGISFTTGGTGTLELDNSQNYTSPISNFARPYSLELTDIPYTSGVTLRTWTQLTSGANASGTLEVFVSGGTTSANLTLLGLYTQSNFAVTSGGTGTLVTDNFSIQPNPATGFVQKDNVSSTAVTLTTTENSTSAITYSVASSGVSTTIHSANYVFAIDEFTLVQNGGQAFNDTFTSNTPPPYSGNASPYNTTGTIIESGGLLSAGSGFALFNSGGTDGQIVILETDTTSNPNIGLKSGESFTLSGVFALISPTDPHNVYGIEFTDGGGNQTGGTVSGTGDGHDQVRLDVERSAAGVVEVNLIQKDATVTGASDTLQSIVLNAGSATQIELQLTNNSGTQNGQVSASFELLSGGTVLSKTSFTATGQIFLPTSGGIAENWTRPGFFAFAPNQSDAYLSGSYGTIDVTQAGVVTYGLNNSAAAVQNLTSGQTLSDNFTITATNGTQSASVPADFTIEGTNPTFNVKIAGPTSGGAPVAVKFTQFLAFGDSDIDSGYFFTHPISTNPLVEAQYQAAVAAGGGIPTSLGGVMNSVLLAADYGLTALPVGEDGGTNYAASGAVVTGTLLNQLAPTIDSQIQGYLAANNFQINPDTLILLSGGGNDVSVASSMDPASADAYLIAHAQVMANDIAALENAGARYIIMTNLDGGGILGAVYKAALQADVQNLGVQLIFANDTQLISNIQADPAAYGIVNANQPPGGPFSNSFAYSPAYGGADLDPVIPGVNNNEPDKNGWSLEATQLVSAGAGQTNLYSDDEHLAAIGQQLEASYNESLLQNAVPVPGETLSATPTLSGTTDTTSGVTYQWEREALDTSGWNPISGATSLDYVVQPGDGGYRLEVEGFYTPSGGGQTITATSLETYAVAQVVSGGQTSSGVIVLNEGTLIVFSGGTASGTVLSGGAQEFVSGKDVSGTVGDGATQIVFSGGITSSTTVSSGGTQIVLSGGAADPTTIFSGGSEIVSSGGTAIGIVLSGGTAELAAGAIAASGGITFAGVGGDLRIDGTTSGRMPTAVILGLRPGDTIDLTSVPFSIGGSITLTSGNVLSLREDGQADSFNLDPAQNFAGWNFKLSSDGATGTDIRLGGQVDDFNFDRTSDILFINDNSGDTWVELISNGAFGSWSQIGGSSTSYAATGVGDFFGTGTSDALFLNVTTGDTWIEAISNGAFAGWSQIGGSSTGYSVAGVADFYGNATDDILFRNNSSGDTWIEAISNGAFAGWHQVGGSDTHYAVAGVGDFTGNGTDDILFRDNSTGDTWIEAISSGAFNGWHQIGGSDTHYSVVGVGDFFGNGTDDILFRNNSSGDTWIEAISNGAFKSWNQIGGSDTHYAVVAVGDYFGNGTDDILFRNNSTGDTWIEAISNGSFNGWHQVGGSNTGYTVKT